MTKWQHTFRNGKTLRAAIDSEDSFLALEELGKGLKVFMGNIKEDSYMFEEFEELQELVQSDLEDGLEVVSTFILEEYGESIQDYINGRLSWFYDLCDSYNVWVEI